MSRIVIENVEYFNSPEKKLEDPKTIIISDGKFEQITTAGNYEKGDSNTVIDGTGKYLLPGMIDCHVHLSYKQEFVTQPFESLFRTKDGEKLIWALLSAQKYLVSGFTTVRDCASGMKYMLPALRDSIANGLFYGSRLLVAEMSIGQHGRAEQFGPSYLLETIYNEFNEGSGKDNIMHAVRERKRRGADFIKTATTGGVLHGKGSKIDITEWTLDELEAMVSEAERIGMHVAAHCHQANGVLKAVQAGIHTIEHGTFLTEEIVKLMKDKGTYLVPTLMAGTFSSRMSDEIKKKMKPEALEKWEKVSAEMLTSHKMAYENGVKIAFGTDLPVSEPHGSSALELELMHKHLGMSAEEVLASATIESAKAIRMDDFIGSIEVGKLADCVLVNKNPVENITIFQDRSSILKVIKNGELVAEKGKLLSKDLF